MNPKIARVWQWAGTPAAARVLFAGMCLYFVALGVLVAKQASLVRCQAEYASASARSTQARAAIAAEDRRLDRADDAAEELTRASFGRLLIAMRDQPVKGAAPVQAAFTDLLKTQTSENNIRAANRAERLRLEDERRKNPPAAPPETFC